MSEKAELTFEQAVGRLEEIVHQLEDGCIGLEESLSQYEEGTQLLRRCFAILQNAERSVALLTGVDAEGNPVTQPFDATATLEAAKAEEPGAAGRGDDDAGSRPTRGARGAAVSRGRRGGPSAAPEPPPPPREEATLF